MFEKDKHPHAYIIEIQIKVFHDEAKGYDIMHKNTWKALICGFALIKC